MAEKIIMPAVPLRGLTIFPRTILHFDIGRDKSIKALEYAMDHDKLLFLVPQKDENVLIPTPDDYYRVGTVVRVKQMLKVKGDSVRVLVDGQYRATITNIVSDYDYLNVETEQAEIIPADPLDAETEALRRIAIATFDEYVSLKDDMKPDAVQIISGIGEPDIFCDTIAMQLDVKIEQKQKILEDFDVKKRLLDLIEIIRDENQVLSLELDIKEKVDESVKENQKEYLLREQMKAISQELGMGEEQTEEIARWQKELEDLHLDPKINDKIKKEIGKYQKMMANSPDASVVRGYVETVLELPWDKESKTNSDLKKAEKILNEDHFGLNKVKERILEYLAVIHLSKAIKGPIICLVGPPGVGKTSIAKSIARATGREFVRMSLGGVKDEAEIRGHRRTYIGAIPGRVISLIKDAGTRNPVFLLDEVDKVGADYKGDPSDALLEVLDPEQNKTFTDHFLDLPFDLSDVMFITTANTMDTIPRPLLDRMEVINISGYTEDEKVKIATKYLIPKEIKANGLKPKNIDIPEKTVRNLINYYTRESGVRNLEREIGSLCRKVAKKMVQGGGNQYRITPSQLEGYLGKKKFHYDVVTGKSEVGVVTGLAWTEVGGDTLFVETQVLPGSGNIKLTGQLGDVMQESALAAITYIRSIANEYEFEKDWYRKKDIHVHVPEGAVPKDGPSAGVTMFTSVLSALTGIPVRKDVAMTGEITLRGNVLPVGGIKEKVLAAHRMGIKTIMLPEENKADLDEIPTSVKKQIEFVFIKKAKDVLDVALVK